MLLLYWIINTPPPDLLTKIYFVLVGVLNTDQTRRNHLESRAAINDSEHTNGDNY